MFGEQQHEQPLEIRCVHVQGDEDSTLTVKLDPEHERVVNVDHQGNDWWVYIERTIGLAYAVRS